MDFEWYPQTAKEVLDLIIREKESATTFTRPKDMPTATDEDGVKWRATLCVGGVWRREKEPVVTSDPYYDMGYEYMLTRVPLAWLDVPLNAKFPLWMRRNSQLNRWAVVDSDGYILKHISEEQERKMRREKGS